MAFVSGAFLQKQVFAGALEPAWRRFRSWYLAELAALFPPQFLRWMFDCGERQIVLRKTEPGIEVSLLRGAQVLEWQQLPARETVPAALADFMARRAVSRKSAMIGLELPRERFFTRHFDIPAAARANLDRLVAAEVERKTPFRLGDIFVGQIARSLDARQSKFRVEQWIVKRDIVENAARESGLAIEDVDFVKPAFTGAADAGAPIIALRQNTPTSTWFRKTLLIAGGLACLFAFMGVVAGQWRASTLSETLDAEIKVAAAKAAAIRKLADQAGLESGLLDALRAEKAAYPPLADVLEDVSRILPDGTWVAEFRLKEPRPGERAVTISGFSDSAADLVALLDGSRLFSNTSLTAPITPDPSEHRERFALETKVMTTASVKAK